MKKRILFILACVFSFGLHAQVNYYVSSGGNDANDGLSETSPMATVGTAFDAATASYTANQTEIEYIINVGEGVFEVSNLAINSLGGMSITIKGEGANATTLQGGATVPSEAKLFANPAGGAANEQFKVYLEDLKIYNYGFSDGTSGAIINLNGNNAKNIYFTASRCLFSTLQANSGAVIQSNHLTHMTFSQCSFVDITATNYSEANAIFNIVRGDLSIENCVFSRCVRDYSWIGAEDTEVGADNAYGVLISSKPIYNWVANNLSLINNTFVDCGIVKGEDLSAITNMQSLIYMSNPHEGNKGSGGRVNATIANNLILGTSLDGVETSLYVDINVVNTDPDVSSEANGINFTSSTNNLLSSQNGFPTDGNNVNPAFTYDVLDFEMDGEDLAYRTSDNGLIYPVAKGEWVVGQALAALQPSVDIVGTTRPTDGGCIGAVEYVAENEQFITFPEIAAVHIDDAVDIVLEENSSVGLPVTYVSSDESIATIIDGHTLHPVAAGLVTITASQAGDENYNAAPDVVREVYFADDTATYYVRPEGDDVNNGLTVENAVATLSQAASLVVNQGLSYVYIIDVDGEITSGVSSGLGFDRDEDILVMIQGAGADQTIYKMAEDADFDAVIGTSGQSLGRMFSTVRNTGAGNVSLEITDMSFRNFGFTNSNGGAFLNLNVGDVVVDVAIKRCNFENGIARSGALIQANNGTVSVTMEDCFVGEMMAINNNTFNSPITFFRDCSFSASNCVFSHFVKAAELIGNASTDSTTYQGNVISFTPGTDSTSLVLINNTFIGDRSLRTEALIPQATVLVYDSVQAQATIANNLFIGGGATTSAGFYNVYFPVSGTVLGETSHNVMLAQNGFTDEDNSIDAEYTYSSPEIDFYMDGDYPVIFTAENGVKYVVAKGTEVAGKALASVAPVYDIAGNERAEAPTIGACEADDEAATFLPSTEAQSFGLYPNPVQSVVYVDGQAAQLAVYNVAGQLVRSYNILDGRVDMSALKQGLYIVNVKDASGVSLGIERLIKK